MLMSETDLYELFQIAPHSDQEQIRAAYRALVKKYHPDAGQPGASNEMMISINEAYRILSDPQRRHQYNLRLFGIGASPGTQRHQPPLSEKQMILRPAPGIEFTVLHVPEGSFLMGRRREGSADVSTNDGPQHSVFLPHYYIGKHPVTVAQFAAFVAATGYRTSAQQGGDASVWTQDGWTPIAGADWEHPTGPRSQVWGKQTHPVTVVSWDDAQAFCAWVGRQTRKIVRLPSEAEWEKAARGTDGRLWPWGDHYPHRARANLGVVVKDTLPISTYSPQGDSPYGCVDMVGNIWEWTNSIYQSYPYRSTDGREEPRSTNSPRVLRGGPLWLGGRSDGVVARDSSYPASRASFTGFRICVLSS
jgi:formylglycine-generating enzyme required for sulfatase activity